MNETLDFRTMFSNSRSQVYLVWAALVGIGYVATHFYQTGNINVVWLVISIIGFVFMYKVMPLRVAQMKKIYASWLIPISVGIGVSVLAVPTSLYEKMTEALPSGLASLAQAPTENLTGLVGYLGAFWLVVQAVGFFWNGIVDSPGLWYYIVAAVNLIAAGAIYSSEGTLLIQQYLVVAVVSVWSMLMLWVFRSE